MTEIEIPKEELGFQLLPFIYKETIVLSILTNEINGLVGIKKNTLIFISEEKLDKDIKLQVPENLTEINELLVSAEWVLQRAMMTPNLKVIDWDGPIEKILETLALFTINYKNNSEKLERLKHGGG